MATDRESEKKKRSSTSISEDKSGSKRRRASDEEEKSRKGSSSSREKGERDKSRKHRRSHSDKEKKSKEKRKSKEHKRHSVEKPCDLSNDDYFSKNNEFSTWLKEEKKTFFSDLSSENARDLFSKFVKRWNSNELDSKYYEGIATAPRTAHAWGIKK